MQINDSITNKNDRFFSTSYNYWKTLLSNGAGVDKFTYYILTSIFPLISLFLVVSFGYFNPRYEKSRAITFSLISIIIYYIFIKILSDNLLLHSLYLVPFLWLVGTYILYRKK